MIWGILQEKLGLKESVLDMWGLRCLLSSQLEVSSKQMDMQVWGLVVKSRLEI